MAKNWTLKEAREVIAKGTDLAAIQEIGKKFPLTTVAIAKMGTNEGVETLFGGMPEHMTMLKMERSLKEGVSETEEDDEEEGVMNPPADEADEVEEDTSDLSSKTTKQLYEMCIKKGLKVSKYGKSKAYYIEQLTGATEEPEEEEAEKEADPGYEDMTAVELFKLCKKRGIKAEPKKPAKAYIALLKKADEEIAAANEEADDDWDDEEEEEKPAKKPEKKAAKKPEKKAAKKAEPEDDDEEDEDEDDWDI